MKIQDDRCLMDVRVVGYQFPDRVPDKRETVDYDANWLTVSVRYMEPDFTAEFQDPCVLTWEVQEAAEALNRLIDGKIQDFRTDFLEPFLRMEAEKVEDEFWMRVCFVCEVDKGERKEITAVQRMDRERLAEILDEVKGVVQRFPKR